MPTSAMRRTLPASIICKCSSCGDRRPQHAGWYDRLRQRRFYSEALEKWFNAAYLALMKEKGAEVQSRVKAIVGGFDPGARVSLRQKTGASFVIEEIVETILSKKVENEAA